MTVIGLENVEHPEHGVITVDLDLLQKQLAWLENLPGFDTCILACKEREGLLNLLGGIMDLADSPSEDGTETEDDAKNAHGLNIRFLTQGMVKLSPDDLPPGFYSWSREDQIGLVKDRWDTFSKKDLLEAVAFLDIEEDSVPDCLEVDNESYDILAQTRAWEAFNAPGGQVLIPTKED